MRFSHLDLAGLRGHRLPIRSRQAALTVLVLTVNLLALAALVGGLRREWSRSITAKAALPRVPAAAAESFDARRLAGSRIFGAAAGDSEDAGEESPLASLGLVLRGVVTLDRGGLALIGVGGGEARPFRVGDRISQGAVLEALYPDRIVVSRHSETATVMMAGPRVLRKRVDAASNP